MFCLKLGSVASLHRLLMLGKYFNAINMERKYKENFEVPVDLMHKVLMCRIHNLY